MATTVVRHLAGRAVLVRRARASDAAALAELAARTFAAAFGADNDPTDLALFLRGHYSEKLQAAEIADLNLDTLVAAHDSELIGFAQIRTGSTADGVPAEAIELQRFYLDRLWHGSGLAGELMHQSIECARQRHAPYIWLGVWERNPRAIAFYEKSGFKRVGCKTFLVGNDLQHDLVLLRELTDH